MLSAGVILALPASAAPAELSGHRGTKAQYGGTNPSSDPWSAHIREAARRFAIPERLLRAVMHVESVVDVHAVSGKGAMGLMQIMPLTWEELRTRYRLGDDPWQPRDNILAGAAYLREMLDRFGENGFLAAYNAGPRRYEKHLATGRPLPRETIDYVRKLAPLINGMVPVPSRARQRSGMASVPEAAIFAHVGTMKPSPPSRGERRTDTKVGALFTAIRAPAANASVDRTVTDLTALIPQPDSFAVNADCIRPRRQRPGHP